MDRNTVALALMPQLLASTSSPTSTNISDETRARVVTAAFAWADAFLAPIEREYSAGVAEVVKTRSGV